MQIGNTREIHMVSREQNKKFNQRRNSTEKNEGSNQMKIPKQQAVFFPGFWGDKIQQNPNDFNMIYSFWIV